MSRLGPLFEDGDPQAARERYEQAAAGGEPQAMFNLAQGLVGSDWQAAREWYERAAAAGHTGAMNNVRRLLEGTDVQAAHE
jgi:hypothetical protein